MTSFSKHRWKMVKFGDVVKNANLVERDPVASGIERVVGLEHIDPENLHIQRWNSAEESTSFTRKFVPGQTLFGKRRAYQRKVAYAEFEGICSGDILTFEPKDKMILLPELLPFICQSDAFFDHALGTSAGSLSPRTSWTALKDFEFPLPSIDEQKRIAEILWTADESVQNQCKTLVEAQKAELSLAHNLIPVSQLNIFTGKLKQPLPPDFKVVQGNHLFTAQSGNGEPTSAKDSLGDTLFFKVADFNRNNEETSLSDAEVTFFEDENHSIRIFPPGTVIFPKRGATIFLNKVGQLRKSAALDPNLMALVPKESTCLSGYLYWVIKLIRLHRVSETTSLPQLNHKHLMPLWLPSPSLEKQRRIVGLLDAIREQRNNVQEHMVKCTEVKKQLIEKYIGDFHV
ncbi:hypothetical protein FEF65_03775 [Mariprofundus erugo]|uniref:Type I restriction modification DNA specificity domain-containing protein n=1 Tax=Mariprofundus erugo TaxID=2528639 RepID=A0A5R9GSS4_9PROT|nr:restriction endonuclease subunit S [Mariprofundus erugo]TLS68125.1 hypothetical protein FEF65_03775 [Mariprofundus erugo]